MGLSKSDLERLADDTYKGRLITGSIYCGQCGYNLRTLPYVHTCPECGNQYNARPLKMEGIFLPQEAQIPWGDLVAAGFCAGGALLFGASAVGSPDAVRISIAGALAAIASPFVWRAYRGLRRLARTRALAKHIALEEGE